MLVNQVVMDRRSGSSDDFSTLYGVSVGNLIQKFGNVDRMQQLEEEATARREECFRLASEKRELEHQLKQRGQAPVERRRKHGCERAQAYILNTNL